MPGGFIESTENKYQIRIIATAVLIVAGVVFSYFSYTKGDRGNGVVVTLGNTQVVAEVADTPETRGQGLSGRDVLKEEEGMWFVFEAPGYHGFYMKDMNFPIDMIWLDENYRVVDAMSNRTPESYPEVFIPAEPAQYVLEVNAGFIQRYGISIGDSARLE